MSMGLLITFVFGIIGIVVLHIGMNRSHWNPIEMIRLYTDVPPDAEMITLYHAGFIPVYVRYARQIVKYWFKGYKLGPTSVNLLIMWRPKEGTS